jgi:transketolase
MSGPSHHCLEDLAIVRTLPNMTLCSPSDWVTAGEFVDFAMKARNPKYIRLDGKPLPRIYEEDTLFQWDEGICECIEGDAICIVSTGYTTHLALKVAEKLRQKNDNIGIVDVFLLKPINEEAFFNILKKYQLILTIEEAFVKKGGLDSLVSSLLHRRNSNIKLRSLGFEETYIFASGSREFLSEQSHFSEGDIIKVIEESKRFV